MAEEEKSAEAGQGPEAQAAEAPPAGDAEAKAEGAAAEGEENGEPLAPIIIKKIIDEGHGGAHGGAWKIALADMMTAMMAFFLLMWLLGASNKDQRKSVADYFKPSALTKSVLNTNTTSGSVGLMGGQSIIDETALPRAAAQTGLLQLLTPRDMTGNENSEKEGSVGDPNEQEKRRIAAELDKENFEKLQKELNEKLSQDKDLSKLKEQVNFIREKEGLRIEVIDNAKFSMFGLGTTTLSTSAQSLIAEIARSLAGMPNKIKVRGHTDSVPYASGAERNNWALSADRAEVTRRMLVNQGIDEKRFARIEGVADTERFNPADGMDPRNRRISITLMYQQP